MKFRYILIATGMGMGYSPIAPGTVGALGACLVSMLLSRFTGYPNMILACLIVVFLLAGVHSSNKLETEWGKDPSKIVIDEVVGMWISLLLIPNQWQFVFFAFTSFRMLDIYKPFFIKKLERLPGGWGIMADDVAAGIYTNILVQIIIAVCY